MGALPRYDSGALRRHLAAKGVVSESEFKVAQEVARKSAGSELKALLDLGLTSEDALADELAACLHLGRWRAAEETAGLSDALPVEFLRNSAALVLESGPEEPVRVVIADPSDHFVYGALLGALAAGVNGREGEAGSGGANAGLVLLIGTQKEIGSYLEAQDEETATPRAEEGSERLDVSSEISALRDMASEAPVIRYFNLLVERAMDLSASDIHIERFDRRVGVRYRVDGVLIDQAPPPAAMYEPLLCRVKLMAALDIAERRRAQDGRVRLRMRGRAVDMRISIVPTMYGQDAAIRIQDRQKLADIRPEDLGFETAQIQRLLNVANKSHGILLITGPTGSGKTTTLYALLRAIKSPELKIVTVEDPVEYAMDGINQIQVNTAVNLTFGNTLRHILRHDPDVILIGEIRDHETAEMAFQASLTGHMVLSTLHTNSVPSSFVRLVDMGVEPYLVNAAVEGVSAQRLVRRVCGACGNREETRVGCKTCGGLGYRGRVGLMEFAGVTGAVKRVMLQSPEEQAIRRALLESGQYVPMREEARRLVALGVTDEAEIIRALGAGEEMDDVSGEGA